MISFIQNVIVTSRGVIMEAYSNTFTLLLFIFILLESKQTNARDDKYIAAVVGLKAINHSGSSEQAFYLNTIYYRNIIYHLFSKSTDKLDIIIFPEEGLQGENEQYQVELPDSFMLQSPCHNPRNYHKGLRKLSCAAKKKKVYLVVNLAEKYTNSSGVTKIFNTNIVFNRHGQLIKRYRKVNIDNGVYDKPNNEENDSLPTFSVDFTNQFGLLTGVDLFYIEPYHKLRKLLGLQHVINPTKWKNLLPFSIGIQTQYGWSYKNQITLLSAGYHDPSNGYGGTGIYDMDGGIHYLQPESEKAFSLIKHLSVDLSTADSINNETLSNIQPGFLDMDIVYEKTIKQSTDWKMKRQHGKLKHKRKRNVLLLSSDNVNEYTTKLIEPVVGGLQNSETPDKINGFAKVNETLCTNDKIFCCTFHVEMVTQYERHSKKQRSHVKGDNFSNYYYRLAVFDGKRKITNETHDFAQICGIIPCFNKNPNSCALRTDIIEDNHLVNVPPITVEEHGHTYTQIGTTFNIIRIYSNMQHNTSDIYPLILTTSNTPKQFGSLLKVYDFVFASFKNLNSKDTSIWTVTLKTLGDINNLASIGICNRMYLTASSASTTMYVSCFLVIIPLIYFCIF